MQQKCQHANVDVKVPTMIERHNKYISRTDLLDQKAVAYAFNRKNFEKFYYRFLNDCWHETEKLVHCV